MKVERARPQHVKDAIAQIAEMHASHYREATVMDRVADRVICALGTATFLSCVIGFTALWILASMAFPLVWVDQPPYPILGLLLSLAAIVIAVLILANQRRDDQLANRREQMTLQLALLTEQKVGKLIELVEELRRDLPNVVNRIDSEAIEMTGRPDHTAVLDEIQERSQPPTG